MGRRRRVNRMPSTLWLRNQPNACVCINPSVQLYRYLESWNHPRETDSDRVSHLATAVQHGSGMSRCHFRAALAKRLLLPGARIRKGLDLYQPRRVHKFKDCHRQMSTTAGTLFETTGLPPMGKWFAALYLTTLDSRKEMQS